jgi:hypothetical protein
MVKNLARGLTTLGFIGFFIYQQFFQFGSKLEFGRDAVYYTSGATESDARRVGEALQSIGYFGRSDKASVQVLKEGDDFIVRLIVHEKAYTDLSFQRGLAYIGYMIQQSAFPNQTVHIELCDSSLEPHLRIEPMAPPLEETVEQVEVDENTATEQAEPEN